MCVYLEIGHAADRRYHWRVLVVLIDVLVDVIGGVSVASAASAASAASTASASTVDDGRSGRQGMRRLRQTPARPGECARGTQRRRSTCTRVRGYIKHDNKGETPN